MIHQSSFLGDTDVAANHEEASEPRTARPRANELDGKSWLRYSISVWSDIRKSAEETGLNHPAIFPVALARRLIEIFTNAAQNIVLDPFAGVGSTLLAAQSLGKQGIGLELNPEFVAQAELRLQQLDFAHSNDGSHILHCGTAFDLLDYVTPESVDLVITSPPYWDILNMRRSADYKAIRTYSEATVDLGNIEDYGLFLGQLKIVFERVYQAMKAGAYCCVIVMDIRKRDKFYPFHSDIANFMPDIGFIYDDLIIWDRHHEYNNLRPLGYPSVFRVNKVHEFILIFQKPKER